jgi:hypothetical protein
MSALDSQFDDAAAQLNDDLADTVQYSPDGVVPAVTVMAILGEEQMRATSEQDGIKVKYSLPLSLPRTSAAAGGGAFLAAVNLLSQFTINGQIYMVEAIVSQTASWTRLDVYRLVTREKTRQSYRRNR